MTKFHWFQIATFILMWLSLNIQTRLFKQFRPVASVFLALSLGLLLFERYIPSKIILVFTSALLLVCVCYQNPLKRAHSDVES